MLGSDCQHLLPDATSLGRLQNKTSVSGTGRVGLNPIRES